MSRKFEIIQAGSLVVGSIVAAAKTFMQYRAFQREQNTLEYTRQLQREAWEQVLAGSLTEVKVGNMHLRAPSSEDPNHTSQPEASQPDTSQPKASKDETSKDEPQTP